MFFFKGLELIQLITVPRWVPFSSEPTWQSCKWYVQIRIHLWGEPPYRNACSHFVSCQLCAKLGFRAVTPRKGACLVFSLLFWYWCQHLPFYIDLNKGRGEKYISIKMKIKDCHFRNSLGSIFCSILIMPRDISECLYIHSGVMKKIKPQLKSSLLLFYFN